MLACLPIVAGFLGAISAPSHLYEVASVVLDVVVSVALVVYFVPLEKR
jgi:hypothetical protein